MINNKYTSYSLYFIALLFAALAVFMQLLPLATTEHLEHSLALNTTQIVNLTSLFFVSYAIMQIPGGVLLDKLGIKYVLPTGIFLTIIGCYLYWNSNNWMIFGMGRIITGLGCSIAYISGIFIAATFFPQARLPLFIGILEAGSTLGSLAAAQPLAISMQKLGWSLTGNLVIGFAVVLFILAMGFGRGVDKMPKSEVSILQSIKQALGLFKNKKIFPVFIYSWATWFVIMSFAGYWLKDYLIMLHHYSENQALQIVEIYWGSFLVASLLISHFVQNIKMAKFVIFAMSILGFATYMLMAIPLVFNMALIIMVVLFAGLSAVGVIIAFSLIPGLVAKEQCGSAIAINNTFVVFGGYCGQVAFGWIVKNINISNYIHSIDPVYLEPHYYSALLMYPLVTGIALIAIMRTMRQ